MKQAGTIIRNYEDADAAGLLQMWKESQADWPVGFSLASGNSPVRFNKQLKEGIEFIHFIVANGENGNIVGYAGLAPKRNSHRGAVLTILNVHPDFQGLGIGKDLVKHCINEIAKRGFHFLELETWPGNTKAIGLYRRCGFFWIPETQVKMINYVPMILSDEYLGEIFLKTDWYRSLSVSRMVEPDDKKIGKMDVFNYSFIINGSPMIITIDRNNQSFCGIENNQFLAELHLDNSVAYRTFTRDLHWKFWNKSQFSMAGELSLGGLDGIEIDQKITLELNPGRIQQDTVKVMISEDLQRVEEEGSPGVIARWRFEGMNLVFCAGVLPVDPVEFKIPETQQFVKHEQSNNCYLDVINHLDSMLDIAYKIQIDDSEKIFNGTLKLKPYEKSGLHFCSEFNPGQNRIAVQSWDLNHGNKLFPLANLNIGCRSICEVSIVEGDTSFYLQNDFFSAEIRKNSGAAILRSSFQVRAGIILCMPEAGPPFAFELPRKPVSISHKGTSDACTITVIRDSEFRKNLKIVYQLKFTNSPLIKIKCWIENEGDSTEVTGRFYSVPFFFSGSRFIPTKDGILHSELPSFPFGYSDFPDTPDYFPEKWSAIEFDDSVSGCIWKGDPDAVEFPDHRLIQLDYRDLVISKGSRWSFPENFIYCGPGGFKTVQEICKKINGEPRDQISLKDVPSVALSVKINPTDNHPFHELQVDNFRATPFNGSINIQGNDFLHMNDLEGISKGISKKLQLPIQGKGFEPFELQCGLSDSTHLLHRTIHSMGFALNSDQIQIHKKKLNRYTVYTVKNNRLSFSIAPNFNGSVIDLTYMSQPLLRSPFPQTGTFGFETKWFGGINPEISSHPFSPSVITKWKAESTQLKDQSETIWEGVALTGKSAFNLAENGLNCRFDYLTSRFYPVLAIRIVLKNKGRRLQLTYPRLAIYPGNEEFIHSQKCVISSSSGVLSRYHSHVGCIASFGSWCGYTNGIDDLSMAIIPSQFSAKNHSLMIDSGHDGFYFIPSDRILLSPGQTSVSVIFIVPFIGCVDDAKKYSSMKKIRFSSLI